jgi:MFS family permease
MATMTRAVAGERGPAVPLAHRQVLRALSGLYVGMFVAILASTIVTNALPTIVADMHAGQSTYTWVITSTLLATAVSSPILYVAPFALLSLISILCIKEVPLRTSSALQAHRDD